jgi:hypothetical protein
LKIKKQSPNEQLTQNSDDQHAIYDESNNFIGQTFGTPYQKKNDGNLSSIEYDENNIAGGNQSQTNLKDGILQIKKVK